MKFLSSKASIKAWTSAASEFPVNPQVAAALVKLKFVGEIFDDKRGCTGDRYVGHRVIPHSKVPRPCATMHWSIPMF